MSIRFSGGARLQRGRGIGGLLRLAKNLFQPIVRTVSKAVKSNTGRAIGNALKEQAINSGTNLVTDALMGNDLKEGLKREANTFKERAAEGIQQLSQTRKRQTPKQKQKTVKKKKRIGSFVYT